MLRDMKIFKRGKRANLEEIENVPINPTDSLVNTSSAVDAPRAPLVTIQEPSHNNPRFVIEQEAGFRSKVDRTPSKVQGKGGNSSFRTPEKQGGVGFSTRKKFGWGQKNEQPTSTNGADTYEERRTDVSYGLSQLPPSSRGTCIGNGGLPSVTPRSVRTMGKPTPNPSECSSTQSTPTKSVIKPANNTGFAYLNGSRPSMNIGVRLGNSAALSKGIPMSCASSSVVNTVEVPHFELREDPSFWMDHNVQVLIRIRPLNSMERSSQGYNRCLKQESAQSIAWIGQPEARFTFDHVACESVNQEMLFRVAGLPMVENCLSGYNSCMFAYGQTGSGKTYTMLGEIAELEVKPSPDRGMTPRIFEFLFARIRAEEESRRDEKLQYNCKCSFLEIYNEQITDLLDPSSTNLLLREDMKKGGVYVENLTEFEVQTVNDILSLLTQGAANRKVAATNMNRESSRSHSVFTCVIESRWEKDSTTNLRFARLNLVDLAGSERQKTSGAEGERLKEAASINKSLSTLGHVIMVLVDLAHGKQRHIPYRDSRLTFLLQDSLGGNSKTMIIANVSPSICSAAETLSTLKFAQRAKLIQNNAVVNEDASGDVIALQHQIWLLKEELAVLKRQNVSRSLSFRSAIFGDTFEKGSDVEHVEEMPDMVPESSDDCHESASLGIVRLSTKQMQSLETTLTGALRREQMADTSMKQLEAEIEQLNRLVRQREEDTQCIKMMLKFREDKVRRMESLVGGHIPSDAYLMEENSALSEELQLVRTRVDRNPEVTRFALENIRLLEKLRKFQDFYEEGERELLLAEVSELRDQLIQFLDDNTKKYTSQNMNMLQQEAVLNGGEHDSCHLELNRTYKELEECRNSLNSCLENNAKLTRDIEDLQYQLKSFNSSHDEQYVNFKPCKESLMEVQTPEDHLHDVVCKGEANWKHETVLKYTEEIMNLQLELDILKTLLQEERLSRSEIEERALHLSNDLELEKDRYSEVSKQCEDTKNELKEARSVIEALESQQILFINELEDLKGSDKFVELLSKKEQEISMLQEQLYSQELRNPPCCTLPESEDFPLQAKLQRMHNSLERAKRLNTRYKSDRAFQTSNEQEMDEVRRQVEAETAEVIVCMQEELNILQQQVNEWNAKESETKQSLMMLETEKKDLEEKFYQMTQDKERLSELLQEKDGELKTLSEEWERLAIDIEEVIVDGHDALKDASDEVDFISSSFPQRTWISEKIGNMIKTISEKDSLIDELRSCLEEAQDLKCDMEWKLRSLRGAALAITEAQLQESGEKEKEVLMLTSDLFTKTSIISELENIIKVREDQIRKAEICAMVGFVIVNRFSEINSGRLDALRNKDILITEATDLNLEKDALSRDQVSIIKEAEEQNHTLRLELECSKECCVNLEIRLSEEQERIHAMECKLAKVENDDILKARETLDEFKLGVTTFNSCINEYGEQLEGSQMIKAPGWNAHPCAYGDSKERTEIETCEAISKKSSHIVDRTHRDVCDRDATIVLLRKEIESALESLKEIQAQTLKLLEEKEALRKSEMQSRQSIECIIPQLLTLQAETNDVEKQSDLKMAELVHKLRTVEELVQEARSDHFQNKELLERELCDAKVVAAQKTAEATSLFANFEEAQETMKEADSMVNALMTANETAKLEIARLKKMEATLTKERDSLINEVQSLQFSNAQKDQQRDNLERQHYSDLSEIGSVVLAVEDTIAQFQTAFKVEFNSMLCDFHCLKSQLLHSANLTRSWLEEIWSEIVVKDCAVSVLHLCHMGVLLEAVTGLNAENGLLHHGLSESNCIIVDLKEHNFKAKREVEMCRILKGKLLVDIKSSFDRVSRKEDETGKFNAKLSAFEKKILDLQLQEELMLARSDSMGSELAVLMKELERSNTNALTTFFDQEKQLREKEELVMLDLTAKDFESLILASELKHMAIQKFTSETAQEASNEILENMKKEVILLKVEAEMEKQLFIDMEVEVDLLRRVVEEANTDRNDLSQKLTQCHFSLMKMDQENKSLEQDVQSLNEVACTNDKLKGELGVSLETNGRLSSQVEVLQTETERLAEELGMREAALEGFVCKLQAEIETRDAALNRMSSIDAENGTLKCEIMKLKEDYCRALADLQEKKSEFESSCSRMDVYDEENHRLQNRICSLETCIANLHTDLDMRNGELDELRHCQSIVAEELNSKCQGFETQTDVINSLKEENDCLKSKLMSVEQNKDELLELLTLNVKKCSNSFQAVNMMGNRMIQALDEKNIIILLDKMLNKICENEERVGFFVAECECLENSAKELLSENLSLQAELSRKDEVLKGLSFDLSLLQESASNNKDQKDEFEEMMAAMELFEADLLVKSAELDEAVAHVQVLETQLQEKIDLISTLELDISKERQSLKLVLDENVDLKAQMDDILVAKRSIEEELIERREVTESLEEELFQMDNAVGQMDTFLQGLKNDYNKVVVERDHLDSEVLVLKEKLEMAETLAEEKDAVAVEAQQIAESRKTYAEEKEEEVKLLERSVEELESTVDALENKVDLIKGEAERQRLQREELEMELQSIRHQMLTVYTSDDKMKVQNISSGDVDLQRLLEEKERDLQEAKTQIQYLEKNMNEKEAEISQCRAHISELNLHAEAQARDYKQKFKALEAMAEHVRPEPVLPHAANSPSKKSEKNAAKSRGSGSPFKCIGLGLAHQLKSEKDEELSERRLQIEELEALAANRQKEIFMLNARLAAAESMTHDVIRDLLGVKSDMTNYASLLDHQQVQKITEKAGFHSEETLVKEQEVVKLKQQLHEFIEERQGWLEEINRRHAEVVSARIACEKLRQRDQFLTTENEMLKTENVKHKKKVMELEDEVKKLSGQQNLQQRIHHHAKIKEENNVLKVQNESLSGKLRRSETMLSRVKEELARFRASNGRTPFIDFDEEQQLHNKLKETEEERLQLAQKLVSLCTSILKAAGITRPTSEVSLPVAEDALDQLKDRVSSQESELQDMKFKSKIANEKIRLSELKQQSSPLGSGTDENCTTPPRRLSQTPFLTTLSRG